MIIYKGKRFGVERQVKRLPNGVRMNVETIRTRGGITVLPVNKGKIVLIRQYRPVIEKWIYELPAGGFKKGETGMRCARRELEEETGYTAKEVKYLFSSFPTPGMSTERLYFFMATGLKKGRQALESHEVLSVREFTLKQVLGMIRKGRIIDGKTIQAVLYYSTFED